MNLFRKLLGRTTPAPPLSEGGLYHIPGDDGSYKVLKVLKVDGGGVHVRLYSNVFTSPPRRVDESTLYMAGMDRRPDEPMGMGHLPISSRSFAGWNAVFLQQSNVTDEELEGHRMWLEARGGYF